MFIDDVVIEVGAGRGGAGAASFRREKFVPQGGPDGGDGGRGGDVLVVADPHLGSLQAFQTARHFRAGDGRPGAGARKHGAAGADRRLPVPVGTVVTDAEDGALLGDLDRPGAAVLVAGGGRGGRGNVAFATAVQRAPRTRELGEPGQTRSVRLELKVIADVGLVGLPNSGKSTLLAAWTGAHPRIAAYPFTTLSPNLGVAELPGGRAITIADVPGLIEGAHTGLGLGIAFLRHLERTRVLVHLVDAALPRAEAVAAVSAIAAELAAHSPELSAKPRILAISRADLASATALEALRLALAHTHPAPPGPLVVSAQTGLGCPELLEAAAAELGRTRPPGGTGPAGAAEAEAAPGAAALGRAAHARSRRWLRRAAEPAAAGFRLYQGPPSRERAPTVERGPHGFVVTDPELVRAAAMADLDDEASTLRLQRRLRAAGVEAELRRLGAVAGDAVTIGELAFTYVPDPQPARGR